MAKNNESEKGGAVLITDPLSTGGVRYVPRQERGFTVDPGSYDGCNISLFPREKKKETSPDYGGTISREKESLCDIIAYVKKRKDETIYMQGMAFTIPDPTKFYVDVESQQFENLQRPSIVGTIKIGDKKHRVSLWMKAYEKGNYYSGFIGAIV